MAGRTSLNVRLSPDLSEMVASKVASGRYASASEVVREGLRLLEEQDSLLETGLAEAKAKIRAGLESLDRGEGIPADQVFDALEADLAER